MILLRLFKNNLKLITILIDVDHYYLPPPLAQYFFDRNVFRPLPFATRDFCASSVIRSPFRKSASFPNKWLPVLPKHTLRNGLSCFYLEVKLFLLVSLGIFLGLMLLRRSSPLKSCLCEVIRAEETIEFIFSTPVNKGKEPLGNMSCLDLVSRENTSENPSGAVTSLTYFSTGSRRMSGFICLIV